VTQASDGFACPSCRRSTSDGPARCVRTSDVPARGQRPIDEPDYVVINLDFDRTPEAERFLEILRTKVCSVPDNSPASVGAPQTRLLETPLVPKQARAPSSGRGPRVALELWSALVDRGDGRNLGQSLGLVVDAFADLAEFVLVLVPVVGAEEEVRTGEQYGADISLRATAVTPVSSCQRTSGDHWGRCGHVGTSSFCLIPGRDRPWCSFGVHETTDLAVAYATPRERYRLAIRSYRLPIAVP
jgi:hypothetical protein